MTAKTNQEIDFDLALAIGYSADRVRNILDWVQVWNVWARQDGPRGYDGWQRFDHTDPAVIWPIAERFECFPQACGFLHKQWRAGYSLSCEELSEKAATATALAVIKYVEGLK